MSVQHPTKVVPSLDLLRSYAIFSVLVAHTVLAFGAPSWLAPLQFGGTGVDLFFVLSGWLLGRQLMLELRTRGTIRLGRFWSRRWMRTLPAYYAVLLLTFLHQIVLKQNFDLRWSYLVFLQNYLTNLPYFFVSWSLCVEEHFYLFVAPLLLFAFGLRRWGVALVIVVLVVPFICRTFGLYQSLEQTHVRFDECLMGVALAGASVFAPALWRRLCSLAPVLASLGAALYLWMAWIRWYPQYRIWPDEQTVCAFIFGSFLLLGVSSETWKRRLYLPGSSFLATRAYSVYLLHPEGLAVARRIQPESFIVFLLLAWIVTFISAEFLYRIVERPIMDARERFQFSRSRDTAPSS